MGMGVARFEVWLVNLDPTVGSEIRKKRPCVVVSPDEMNRHLRTVIVAPLTTAGKPYPSRVPCTFLGRDGMVVLDQLRNRRSGSPGPPDGNARRRDRARRPRYVAGTVRLLNP